MEEKFHILTYCKDTEVLYKIKYSPSTTGHWQIAQNVWHAANIIVPHLTLTVLAWQYWLNDMFYLFKVEF